jgi:hypothetical protein
MPWAFQAQEAMNRKVTIRVSDVTGVGIAHARIRLVPTPDAAPAKMETDEKGQLALDLNVGSYAAFVLAQGFKEGKLKINVGGLRGGDSQGQLVAVTLQLGDQGGPVAVYSKNTLVLTAELYHVPVALTPAEFHALPHVTVMVHNGHTNTDESYSGVPLATLLAMVNAPTGKELRGESLAVYVIATGTDGYSAVLSLAEADPNFHGGQVLVADACDGRPLGKNGPFQLIVSEDKHPARWVRNLDSIELQSAR